ncbi:MAG: hypothetical protein AAF789_07360, partial [Bacteroidota bacterium]
CFVISTIFVVVYAQTEKPFQVLVVKDCSVVGKNLQPLQFVDDVTRISCGADGFISLVHLPTKSTFEVQEDVFTFYLQPDDTHAPSILPDLEALYSSVPKASLDIPKNEIELLYPVPNAISQIHWDRQTDLPIYWQHAEEITATYIISLFDARGKKIQDSRTRNKYFILKPSTYGLQNPEFSFSIMASFAGDTLRSESVTVFLGDYEAHSKKAADRLLVAAAMEKDPVLALEEWKGLRNGINGEYYEELFQIFLARNRKLLDAQGINVESLLDRE